MLETIGRIVEFGVRRPGYPEGLRVESWLEEQFQKIGVQEIRREPVPVNRWQPSTTSLVVEGSSSEIPCFAIPYTSWTAAEGLEAALVWLGEGTSADFERVQPRGRIAVVEARFAELSGAALKRGAFFVRDDHHSIPEGPLHAANWLIRNFDAYYQAERAGAVGFIGLLADSPIDGCAFYVPYDGFIKFLPATWVGRENASRLRELARAGRTARLVSVGENCLVDSHNVVGVVPGNGRNGRSQNENIILTCHHDAPFASAVEDASGLAVLLSLAKEFGAHSERLQRDLIIVAASGHFHGGIGNRTFVERHTGDLLPWTVAAVGVEHIAEEAAPFENGSYRLTGQAEVRAVFFDGSRKFAAVLEEEAARQQLDRVICADAYSFGPEPPCDSAPFFTAGIPSACHISGPLYLFDPHDTLDKVRVQELIPVRDFFANVLRRIDAMPAVELAKGMKRPRGSPPAEAPVWFRPPPRR